ncbi:ShlB/FhaC/HecB family hemolysin secretion/activation protein [Erythrobacter sp.]|uniref:ShlB/FhaC/HecB family hemolysin secretion/activation protein n=1 Tax=Erythrobacter sp. TaxID=1042 RepID=UPI003C76F110
MPFANPFPRGAARIALLLAALSVPHVSLCAQTVLDRTEPTQAVDEKDTREVEIDDAPRIEAVVPLKTASRVLPDGRFVIGSFLIDGNEALPDASFVDLFETFTARPLTRADLATLADAVAARAREEGYILATATIPQQSLNLGMLRIELDEGRIDRIELDGAQDAAIRRQLAPLIDAGPITGAELERRILLADDISGTRILDTRYEKDGEDGVLLVRARRSHAYAEVELRNDGSAPVGPERAEIAVDFNGLIDSADEVDFSVRTTPFEPGELQAVQASYRAVVDARGLELGIYGSYSAIEPGAFLEDREIDGRFWRVGAQLSYPLLRRQDTSVWLLGEFEVTDLRQERGGSIARHDWVPAIRAGLYSRGNLAGGDYRGRLILSRGLDILSATDPGDPLASRDDASARFTSLYAWFAWDRPVAEDWSLAIGGRGQLASGPLLATEDLGLGGPGFLRGYNYNERSGDRGIMGYGELRRAWDGSGDWLRGGHLYAYVDGGVVSNLEGGRGGGSLASAGGGVRFDVTRDLELDLELAFPLSGARFDTDSEAPLVNVRIEQSF